MDLEEQHQQPTPLGQELRRIRELHRLSLRAVESLTGISNAYLSQLETGKVEKPSPHYLYKLAEAYHIPYELLMEKAGYIQRHPPEEKHRTLAGSALSALEDLTPEEEEELMNYLAYLRSKNKPKRWG
jgi:transcriptional regulator with XRE-family HTH domain